MADQNKTMEEELAELGVVPNYIWKPNRLFAKSGSSYIPADIISDGSAEEVAQAVQEAGDTKLAEIQNTGAAQIVKLTESEAKYDDIKANLIQTYTRMQTYFQNQGIQSLATIMATAIANLNSL